MNARYRLATITGTLMLTTLTGVPASAGNQPTPWNYTGAAKRSCTTDAASPQIEQGSTIDINVTNNSSDRIFAYWRNWDGNREIPRYVDPGETLTAFYTDNGDIVEIGDNYMNCLAMFVVNTTTGEVNITYS